MAHMTIDTPDPGVRPCVEGDKLRLHHLVACLPAKLDGLRVLVSAITAESTGADEYERQGQERDRDATLARIVQIDLRIRRYLGSRRTPASTPFPQHSDDDDQKAQSQERRQDYVRDYAEIGIIR